MEGDSPVRELDYLKGLSEAVHTGVDYGIEVIAVGPERARPLPLPLVVQPRLSARYRVPLESVILRYLAAKCVLHQFVVNEAPAIPSLDPELLGHALSALESAFDPLIAAASEEYRWEASYSNTTPDGRLAERVRRLLAGEPVDPAPLEYGLSGHHLGLVARSSEVRPLLRELSLECDRRLLAVRPTEGETWAWIGGRRPLDLDRVLGWVEGSWPASIPLGIGEPGTDVSGWRRSHAQARTAAGLAQPGSGPFRYRDVALVAAAARDPLLPSVLSELYLAPLDSADRGELLRETLRAYFAAGCNAKAASAALGVSRQTVANRVLEVEKLIGHRLDKCGDTLRTALHLEELGVLPGRAGLSANPSSNSRDSRS